MKLTLGALYAVVSQTPDYTACTLLTNVRADAEAEVAKIYGGKLYEIDPCDIALLLIQAGHAREIG